MAKILNRVLCILCGIALSKVVTAMELRLLDDRSVQEIVSPQTPRKITRSRRDTCTLNKALVVPCEISKLENECFEANFRPPYPAQADMQTVAKCERQFVVLEWVQPSMALLSDKSRQEILSRGASIRECNVNDGYCSQAIDTNVIVLNEKAVKGTAVCRRMVVRGIAGAPEDCRLIYVHVNEELLVPVVKGFRVSNEFGAVPDDRISFFVNEPIDPSDLLMAIRKQLSAAPLFLATDSLRAGAAVSVFSNSVIGVSGPRRSTDFKLWEQISVRAQQYLPPGGTPQPKDSRGYFQHTEYEITFTVVVNKQATDVPTDWHLPSEYQRDNYRDRLRTAVGIALQSACKSYDWPRASQLACDRRN